MKRPKTFLAIAGATVLLVVALSATASARLLSTSSQTLRATFATVTLGGAFGTIRCPITVEGSFHQRTTSKVAESLVGFITSAAAGACSEGGVTLLRETLPWHIRYASFTGVLPNITSLRAHVIGIAAQVREPVFTCLATSTAANPTVITFNRDVVTKALTTAAVSGEVVTNCGANGSFESTAGPLTVLGSQTRITVTLI